QQKPLMPWVIGGVVSGWLSVLMYESNIVVFALMGIYLWGNYFTSEERATAWRVITIFCLASSMLLSSYLLLRAVFVPGAWAQVTETLPSPTTIAKNVALYVLALMSPVDSVLANEWLRAFLPTQIKFNQSTHVVLGTLGLVIALGLGA